MVEGRLGGANRATRLSVEPMVDEATNRCVVVIVSLPVESIVALQIVGQQGGIELIEGLDRTVGTVAEGVGGRQCRH